LGQWFGVALAIAFVTLVPSEGKAEFVFATGPRDAVGVSDELIATSKDFSFERACDSGSDDRDSAPGEETPNSEKLISIDFDARPWDCGCGSPSNSSVSGGGPAGLLVGTISIQLRVPSGCVSLEPVLALPFPALASLLDPPKSAL
jgi:hypothetical protein